MADVTITALSNDDAPTDYEVPPAQEIVIKQASALYDGTGASGDYVPVLELVSPDKRVVGSWPVATAQAAGASAFVTWFPRGGLKTGSGPTPFAIKEEVVVSAGNITIAANSTGQFSLAHFSGASFLNFAAPTNPTFKLAGLYLIYSQIFVTTGPIPANVYFIRPITTQIAGLGVGSTTPVEGGSLSGVSGAATCFCKRASIGDSALVGLANDSAASHVFGLSDYTISRLAA